MIYVNGRFLTQKLSGVQRFAYNIIIELTNFTKLTVLVPNSEILYDIPDSINLIHLDGYKGHLWEQLTLPNYLEKNSSPVLLNLCNTAPYLYSNNIYTLHDLIFKEYPDSYSFLFKLYYNFSSKYHVNRSKHIFTVSEYSKNKIIKYFKTDFSKVSVVYNAVTSDILSLYNKLNIKNNSNEKYIMTQAYFDINKNIQVLIDAFKKIDTKYNIKLYLVGSHIEKDKLNFEKLLKIPNVKYCGRVSDQALVNLYSQALCYVIPSKLEGFGIPPLEAQACGCPVVSSNTSALPEVVNDSALMFNPESSEELYHQLMKLITDHENTLRYDLQHKGYKNYKRFSYYNSAEKVYSIINSLK